MTNKFIISFFTCKKKNINIWKAGIGNRTLILEASESSNPISCKSFWLFYNIKEMDDFDWNINIWIVDIDLCSYEHEFMDFLTQSWPDLEFAVPGLLVIVARTSVILNQEHVLIQDHPILGYKDQKAANGKLWSRFQITSIHNFYEPNQCLAVCNRQYDSHSLYIYWSETYSIHFKPPSTWCDTILHPRQSSYHKTDYNNINWWM